MNESVTLERRISWLFAIMAAFMVTTVVRLAWLQVVHTEKYSEQAKENRTRHVRDRAQRGRITDRHGRPLATSRPSFGVYITPEDCPQDKREAIFQLLSSVLEVPVEEIKNRYYGAKTPRFKPRRIAADLTFDQVTKIETRKFELPGVSIQAENIRHYPYGEHLCHMLGYVGEISKRELEFPQNEQYTSGDTIGKTGVEKTFEHILNGRDGYRWVEVDAAGRIGQTLKYPSATLAKPGNDIQLTVDMDLQIAVEQILAPWKGSAIIMDPRNGDILAMASRPGFDPNWFSSGISRTNWNLLNNNPDLPLINRSIQLSASPGSVFKIITSIAGFRNNTLSSDTNHFCGGSYSHFNTVFRCWKRGGHGTANVISALEGSCNVFFYQEGLKAGIDAISETANLLGLNAKTQIQLPNENPGFIPDRQWKKVTKNDEWWPGETISVAIGQGGVLVTPIQQIAMISAVANKGTLFRPKIVKNISPAYSDYSEFVDPMIIRRFELEHGQWNALFEGLKGVVNGEHGTARPLRLKEITVAGKTGTAQVVSAAALKKLGFSQGEPPPKYRDHNWFVGFAPLEDPQVSIVLLIENGGKEGAKEKAGLVKKMLLKWMEIYMPEQYKSENSRFGTPTPAIMGPDLIQQSDMEPIDDEYEDMLDIIETSVPEFEIPDPEPPMEITPMEMTPSWESTSIPEDPEGEADGN